MPAFPTYLPQSWAANGQQLAIPAGMALPASFLALYSGIYWNEKVGNEGALDVRYSADQNQAAHITYLTQADSILNGAASLVFFRAILGGWEASTSFKYAPLKHPYLPNLWAKDITQVQFLGPNGYATGDGLLHQPQYAAEYDVAEVTVSYESLPYNPCYTSSTDPGWRTELFQGNNSRVTSNFGIYSLDHGGGNLQPLRLGVQTTRPEGLYRVKYWRVPYLFFLGNLNLLLYLQGCVNNGVYYGYAAETLLLESSSHDDVWSDFSGQPITNITLTFLYVGWGWNKQPSPTNPANRLNLVSSADHSTKPFPTRDFSVIDDYITPHVLEDTCYP